MELFAITTAFAVAITLFSALVRQTIRAERLERRLELAYAVAKLAGRDDLAALMVEEDRP